MEPRPKIELQNLIITSERVTERYGMEPNEVLDNIGKLFFRLFL